MFAGLLIAGSLLYFAWSFDQAFGPPRPPKPYKPPKPPMSKLRQALWIYGAIGVVALIGLLSDGVTLAHH